LHFNPGKPMTAADAAEALKRALETRPKDNAQTPPPNCILASGSAALRWLVLEGYLRASSATRLSPSAPITWSELRPACRKLKMPAPRSSGADSVVTRIAFARWLEKVVVKREGLKDPG
jgi:hypothetical protein